MKSKLALPVALAVAASAFIFGYGISANADVDPRLPDPEVASAAPHRLSETRLLRRASLTFLNRSPSADEYDAVLSRPAAQRRAYVFEQIDAMLDGEEFSDAMVRWGMEYLAVGSYEFKYDSTFRRFRGDYGQTTRPCEEGTLHAGARGFLNDLPNYGEPFALCDDPDAPLHDIEPWWAPGTTVRMIGSAGSGITEVDGTDCGSTLLSGSEDRWPAPGCSCGPNLIYCSRFTETDDASNLDPASQRRSAFEEPARLFAHIIANERPFTDLIMGDYTVVNRGLYHMYLRNGRRNTPNAVLDESQWWREFSDDLQWREVPFAQMHPNLLDDRNYAFDPRTDGGSPLGVPSAGVLSSLGANAAFARERVRAARWLETLACRDFVPPPGDVEFAPYERDPGTEGTCEHCHQLIDPAAMFFKRMHGGGAQLGGVGSWSLGALDSRDAYLIRSLSTYEPDTLMTPVDALTLETHPDAALIDFLPEDYTLFGEHGDGTIGPLGFAKLLVSSGEFDRCTVRRVYRKVTGIELVEGRDTTQIDSLMDRFVGDQRSIKALMRHIVRQPEFSTGW